MASGAERARRAVAFALLVLVATGCEGRNPSRGTQPPPARTAPAARIPSSPFPGQDFFVGAWCSPRTSTTDGQLWVAFARNGLTLAVRPLEDANDRVLNLRMLGILDTLVVDYPDSAGARRAPMALVRDNAVHPDETSRPGWQDRVNEVVAAYRNHRSLAGYFVADEPRPDTFDRIGAICRAFADADSVHPAYVNVLAVQPNASEAEQAQWRADVTRLITLGHLRLFSTDPYAHTPRGEDAGFLLTLQNAAQVTRETGCAFVPVLQFTGYADRDPVPPAVARYLANEAVAYGASGIVWFTYWTPTPAEKVMQWRGGAIDYDGTRTARADAMREASDGARRSAPFAREGTDHVVAHFGGAMPRGGPVASSPIPGLVAASGGPLTISAKQTPRGPMWLVINRDATTRHTFKLTLDALPWGVLVLPLTPVAGSQEAYQPKNRTVSVDLEPGGSAFVYLLAQH